jgi:hypothetical protein
MKFPITVIVMSDTVMEITRPTGGTIACPGDKPAIAVRCKKLEPSTRLDSIDTDLAL